MKVFPKRLPIHIQLFSIILESLSSIVVDTQALSWWNLGNSRKFGLVMYSQQWWNFYYKCFALLRFPSHTDVKKVFHSYLKKSQIWWNGSVLNAIKYTMGIKHKNPRLTPKCDASNVVFDNKNNNIQPRMIALFTQKRFQWLMVKIIDDIFDIILNK